MAEKEAKLSLLDRMLTLWIFLAMAIGIGIGYIFPGVSGLLDRLSVGTTSIPAFVKIVVAFTLNRVINYDTCIFDSKPSLASDFSGLSHTSFGSDQSLVLPVHRSG